MLWVFHDMFLLSASTLFELAGHQRASQASADSWSGRFHHEGEGSKHQHINSLPALRSMKGGLGSWGVAGNRTGPKPQRRPEK